MHPRARVGLQERRPRRGVLAQFRARLVDVLDHGDDLMRQSQQRHVDMLRHLTARHDEIDAGGQRAVRYVGDAAERGVQCAHRPPTVDLVELLSRRRLVVRLWVGG